MLTEQDTVDVLSDVHAFKKYEIDERSNCAITRFKICLKRACMPDVGKTKPTYGQYTKSSSNAVDIESDEPKLKKRKTESNNISEHDLHYDEDGDLILRRRNDESIPSAATTQTVHRIINIEGAELPVSDTTPDKSCTASKEEDDLACPMYISIQHSLATGLQSVGEQIWQGALLLCDYILHHAVDFSGHCVVDLGAGTGLTSIIAALFADQVFCTDTGDSILKLAKTNLENAQNNCTLYKRPCPVHVRDLDWFKVLGANHNQSTFGLSDNDRKEIKASKVLIAADVIYDNDITDAFFDTVKCLMIDSTDKTLYVGLEKRLVFTLDDLDVTSPGYNYFRQHLDRLSGNGDHSHMTIKVESIPTDFPQYLEYNRTPQLEIWKITSSIDDT